MEDGKLGIIKNVMFTLSFCSRGVFTNHRPGGIKKQKQKFEIVHTVMEYRGRRGAGRPYTGMIAV